MFDILRVEWSTITNALVASLCGPVDREGAELIAGVGVVAESVEDRVLVDLTNVTAADANGVELLDSLARFHNVGIVNLSAPVIAAMETMGYVGF